MSQPTTHIAYTELHCLSNYSFLRGASHPEELVQAAYDLGYQGIALTDECTFSGLVKAHLKAKAVGLKLIVGAEFWVHLDDSSPAEKLILLAKDRTTYGQLSTLISKLRRRSPKGTYHAKLEDFRWGVKECLALWIPTQQDIVTQNTVGQQIKALFPDCWIALELFRDGRDLDKTAHALTLSSRLALPIVASNDVHTHHRERQPLQDTLTAIRLRTSVAELGYHAFPNAERTLRPIDELLVLYPIEMLHESMNIAARCQFSMDELRYEYPKDLVPPHLPPAAYLRQLTYAGATERWPQGIPAKAQALVEKELAMISELRYEHYFLTVQDIVQFARSRNILCQGRGSAANSAVCYCLFITEVDPARMHLLFERFISNERNEPPDIDVDFEHERREEVIQYIYQRYGRERAALAATLITYRPRSAIRDVGKALGLDLDVLDLMSKSLAWWDKQHELPGRLRTLGIDPDSPKTKQFLYMVNLILGFPRHLSQHVGGFVIAAGHITSLVPVENASMPDRTVIQWDKDDLEALGLMKIDVLALGMLTAIRKALDLCNGPLYPVREQTLCIQHIPAEDRDTYAMLQRGDSVGVFQVESRAQMAMLPRLKPQNFYDLVVEVAIVRPGPIQGDMVHPYLRRRQGLEPVTYPSPEVKTVLERTLGVPIFQEQVIELAMVAAGFSGGEADQLRRAMAAWKKRGGLEHFEDKLVQGMLARGHDRQFAERVFNQIKGFGDYGFPESHAASFALLVYVSAWLKCHHPAAFYCGLLNSLPMGFYSPSQLVQDGKRHGIEVRPIDVCHSQWDHTLEAPTPASTPASTPTKKTHAPTNNAENGSAGKNRAENHSTESGSHPEPALRLGLRMVKGLREEDAQAIVAARQTAPLQSSQDLAQRSGLGRPTLEFLARAGALEALAGHRHQAHWDIAGITPDLPLAEGKAKTRLDAGTDVSANAGTHTRPQTDSQQLAQASINLPAPSANQDMLDDYRYTSLTLGPHPIAMLRNHPRLERCISAADIAASRPGKLVKIAGLVTGRQRPGTASGVIFLTLEDETGNTSIIVWRNILARFRAALLQSKLLILKGVVEREGIVVHVVAGYLEDASDLLTEMNEQDQTLFRSRDFH